MDDIWAEIMLCDPLTQINGISIIADCKNLNSSILKWIIPKNCKVGAAKLEAFPVKEWTIHLVNMGSILKMCTMLIKPFLKKSTVAKVSYCWNKPYDAKQTIKFCISVSVQISPQWIQWVAWLLRQRMFTWRVWRRQRPNRFRKIHKICISTRKIAWTKSTIRI